MSKALRKATPVPCGSCPYRRGVPPGIWHRAEYEKLPQYDGETWEQHTAIFLCHQNDGHLCSGWLACHNPHELLALRINRVHPSVYDYTTDVPVFASGRQACDHGIAEPGPRAKRMMDGIVRKRKRGTK